VLLATSVFVYLGAQAVFPSLPMSIPWIIALCSVLVVSLLLGGLALWRTTDFS
jgi:hypothetical protein